MTAKFEVMSDSFTVIGFWVIKPSVLYELNRTGLQQQSNLR